MHVLIFLLALCSCEAMAPQMATPRARRITARVSDPSPLAKTHRPALRLAGGASVGSVLQGFNMGIIAGAILFIVPEFGLQKSPGLTGLIAGSATFGAIAGSLSSGRLGDAAGRRGTLIISSILYLIGGIVMGWSPTARVLVCGRLISGSAAGLVSSTVGTYIVECAKPEVRGALSMLPQLGISSGILLSYFVSLATMLRGKGWRLMLGASVLPAVLQAFLLCFLPESPRWLLAQVNPILFHSLSRSTRRKPVLSHAIQSNLLQFNPTQPSPAQSIKIQSHQSYSS